MRIFKAFTVLLTLSLFTSCIGDDIDFDTVPENLRINALVDTLGVGDDFQFEAIYTNNVGIEENITVNWSSTDENIIRVSPQGLATGVAEGQAEVVASVDGIEGPLTESFLLEVADNTVMSEPLVRNGELQTTSSYTLTGSFTLEESGDDLLLTLEDNYRASSSLPGLYLYLTNNPSTTSGAYEVGKAISFSGAHSYTIPAADGIDVSQYTHVLYFCKPFNVKVGDGAFEE